MSGGLRIAGGRGMDRKIKRANGQVNFGGLWRPVRMEFAEDAG